MGHRSWVALLPLLLAILTFPGVTAQSPGTLSDTAAELQAALSELPNGLGPEIQALMTELGMTQSTTHYRPFYDLATGEKINNSIALIRYPTVDNNFTLDFLKLTHSLDATKGHAMMVCGHARPDQCQETVPHLGAEDEHPCGASDASDPAIAQASGFFCELLNATTTTTHGEVLVYGAEKIEFLEQAHAEDLAAGLVPQLPVLHLEIVEIEDLLESLDFDYEDYDFGLGPASAPEASAPVGAPGPEGSPGPESSPGPALAPEGSRRRVARRLLRIGGRGGRGGGFRGGIGGVGRFRGGIGGMRGGMRGRRGVGNNLATQMVLRSSYYGNPATSGQIAYYGTSTVGK